LEELLVLPARALVVGQAAPGGVEVGPGLVPLRLDLPEAGGGLLGFNREIANLEVDVLQRFQCLQLLSRQRLPPSGLCFFAPLPRDVNANEQALAAYDAFRNQADTSAAPAPAGRAGDWARQESNLHAAGYEPDALTVELRARNPHTVPRSVASAHH